MATGKSVLREIDIDTIAVKPSEFDVELAGSLPIDRLIIDYEGVEHFPATTELDSLDKEFDVMVTTPVRADGFDPIGDRSIVEVIPPSIGRIVVAGHPAYLSPVERERAIAPRLGTAVERNPSAWVGTEGIERIALATGATQFDLLSAESERKIEALRAAGFEGSIAVYAPTVPSENPDTILDAIGDYVARRRNVADRLPAGEFSDSNVSGDRRAVLLRECRRFALTGSLQEIGVRISSLRSAGADDVVAYPAPNPSVLRSR